MDEGQEDRVDDLFEHVVGHRGEGREEFVAQQAGLERAAWLSASAVVAGLAVYSPLGGYGYGWVALALVLVAVGMRVCGVVAGIHVLRGLPESRTTIGAALVDTVSEVVSGVAVSGTVLAALFTGALAAPHWSARQTAQFRESTAVAGLALSVLAAALVGWGFAHARRATHEGG